MKRASVIAFFAASLATAACTTTSSGGEDAPRVPLSAMPVLASSSVPGVASRTTDLGVRELARDALIRGLASRIQSWGYLDGRERTFQGESRHLTMVISRSLVFRTATGAAAYVAFVRAHQTGFFGIGVGARARRSYGRQGWQFQPASCACHLANPVVVGVLDDGTRVVWLEINGPDATAPLLHRLLDPARSAPASLGSQTA